MLISEITAAFSAALRVAFPDAQVTDAKTVQQAVERVAVASGKPVITVCPGRRDPAPVAGRMGQYGGVVKQELLVYVGAQGGIARRGEAQLALADLAAEAETACLACDGDWTDPAWESSEPATLPDGYPLDAWLIRISLVTSQFSIQPE